MSTLLLALLLAGSPARADSAPAAVVTTDGRVEATDPTRAPRSAALIGAGCSFRTGSMARQVVTDGQDYAYVGHLKAAAAQRSGEVACPYRIGNADGACVVANELVEHLVGAGLVDQELSLEGRTLEVDGVRYVVLTAYERSRS